MVVVIKYRITINVVVKSRRGKKYTEISWVCAPTAGELILRGNVPTPADGGERSAEISAVHAAKHFADKVNEVPTIDEIEVVITGLSPQGRPPRQDIYDAAFSRKA